MTQINEAVQRVRTAAMTALSDADLLTTFLEQRDETAFAALVQRYGSMVWGVCRRLLNHHDAEDAFQAVFLILFRKAESIKPRRMVSNWLYGVAYQAALHARRTATRRNTRERQVAMPEPAAPVDALHDLRVVLDAELSRLPDRYRAVIVLCDLEGKTRKEAAHYLGCAEGTVSGQLARGRAMLARRLRRHGLGVSGAALAALLAETASAMPRSIVSSAITTVLTQALSAKVAVLAEGVLKAMLVTKLTKTLGVVLVLGLIAAGATLVGTASQDAKSPAALERPVEQAPKHQQTKQPTTAWGDVVGGLQAGLGFRPGEHRVYHHGETVTLVLRLRNVGKEPIKFSYLQPFEEHALTVTGSDGKVALQPSFVLAELGQRNPGQVELQPGKEIELHELKRRLKPASESDSQIPEQPYALFGTGKISVQYEKVFEPPALGLPGWRLDPALRKLATGKLEMQVQDAEKREDGTAWGKQAGGLQAGLQVQSAKRVYHHGEKVRLLVRVRNVSKEAVKFEYIPQFLDENSPAVTDANGKKLPQDKLDMFGVHGPVEVSLEPGKEIVLESRLHGAAGLPYELRTSLGTGKIGFQLERVLGNSSSGFIKLDPKLNKLGTGKLEVEVTDVKDAEPWGKEVEGLLCRLRADNKGELKLTVRDLGKRDLVMHKAEPFCEIEFDGTWFHWEGGVSVPAGIWPAGRRYDDFEIPVSLGPRWRDGRGNGISLTAGKHTLRVAYVTRDKTPVRAVSNSVEIEVAPSK
jgi:RNA polymerase sigma factor (sigma-70 family)